MVRKASISSVTVMAPISAEIDEPDRPMTTIAAINGPNSRVMLVPTRLMTTPHRAEFAQLGAALKSHDQTGAPEIKHTTGSA